MFGLSAVTRNRTWVRVVVLGVRTFVRSSSEEKNLKKSIDKGRQYIYSQLCEARFYRLATVL